MNADYYEILGIKRDAGREEIRQAYRKLSKQYHPDVNDAANAAAMFRLLEEAYATLYDEGKRAAYDRGKTAPQPQEPPRQAYTGQAAGGSPGPAAAAAVPARRMPKAVLWPLRVIFSPVWLVLVFLEQVFGLLGALVSGVSWFLSGVGVLAFIYMWYQNDVTTALPYILASFLLFLVGMLGNYIPGWITGLRKLVRSLYK